MRANSKGTRMYLLGFICQVEAVKKMHVIDMLQRCLRPVIIPHVWRLSFQSINKCKSFLTVTSIYTINSLCFFSTSVVVALPHTVSLRLSLFHTRSWIGTNHSTRTHLFFILLSNEKGWERGIVSDS